MAGAIAARNRDWPRMAQRFGDALDRNDDGWYAWYELGSARSELGDRVGALAAFRRARRLDPLEPEIPYSIADAPARRQGSAAAARPRLHPPRDRRGGAVIVEACRRRRGQSTWPSSAPVRSASPWPRTSCARCG
jgi:hypothetical protein